MPSEKDYKMQKISAEKRNSPFVKKYSTELIKWASYIENSGNDILAISRKGPRLLELLNNDGLLSKSTLDRTFTEYAFPFISNLGKLTIVDDSVLYGTTLNNNITRAATYLNLSKNDVEAVPFKYSIDTPDKVKEVINLEVSNALLPEDSANYIGTLISSFKSLGKPYDIEHPVIYIDGDFSDTELLKVKLETITNLVSENLMVENDNGVFLNSYSILISGDEIQDTKTNPEFAKIRIYLNRDYNRLTIVPISPFVISNDRLNSSLFARSPQQQEIWRLIIGAVQDAEKNAFCSRSLVVIANYLNSFSLFIKYLKDFGRYFDISEMRIDQFDLQLLLGFELSHKVTLMLNSLLALGNTDAVYQNISSYSGDLRDSVLPAEYQSDYASFLAQQSEALKTLNSEAEIINQIFYAQHYKIEITSRQNEKYLDYDRLKFGVTLRYIIKLVKNLLPDYSIKNIHSALDKLIDNGAIVPKYLNLSFNQHEMVWGRVFRIGEGSLSTSQKLLTIIQLFRNLQKQFGTNSVPALALEKYSVIALTNTFGFDELNEESIINLGIKKKFSLYGARSFIVTDADGTGNFALDWAKDYKVLQQIDNDSKYSLNEPAAAQYLQKELGLSNTAKDKLEDIAYFCYQISTQINEDALITLTTLASQKEYWQAISAELNLWLNHPSFNIYNCVNKLQEINNDVKPSRKLLNECNILLENNANYTAQVAKKSSLLKNYKKTIDKIDEVVLGANNISSTRVWRNLKNYLTLKQSEIAKDCFVTEILTVLRVAHELTSLCRTLLNKAGLPIPEKLKLNPRTVTGYLNSILHLLSVENDESSYVICHHFQNNNVQVDLRKIIIDINENTTFSEAFDHLRDFIVRIADLCYDAYLNFGIDPTLNPKLRILNPPVYIVMWDMRKSTSAEDRLEVEKNVIFSINEKIKSILSTSRLEDLAITSDDGNSFLTTNFNDVLAAFEIIIKVGNDSNFKLRVGCDVNYEGELHIYSEKKIIGGRAYEYAARTTSLYKEIKQEPLLWEGDAIVEPDGSYLVLGEFVKRIAKKNGQWQIPSNLICDELPGEYSPRLKKATIIPYSIFQLVER